MKTLKYFTTVIFMAVYTASFAQFANSGTSFASNSSAITDNYSRFYGSFNVLTSDDLDENLKGATIGLLFGENVAQNALPIFFEYGVEMTWNTHNGVDDYDDDLSYKTNLLSFSVPLNLAYRVEIPNTNAILAPFAGLNLKVHALGKEKWEDDYYDESESYDIFDKKEMEGNPAKRFQIGMNLGVGISLNKLFLGYKFQPDFTPFFKKGDIKTKTHFISVGVNF